MILLGYRDFNFSPGFSANLEDSWASMPGVTPQVIKRPGYFPTFGPSEIEAFVIETTILYHRSELDLGEWEAAFAYLMKRLRPYDLRPGELRAESNANVKQRTSALIGLSGYSGGAKDLDTIQLSFTCVAPWEDLAASTTTGTF